MTIPKVPAGTKQVESLRRGLDVLRTIQQSSAITFTELQKSSGIPKATLVRLLKTLVESGWVKRNEVSGRYFCMPVVQSRTSVPTEHERLGEIAYPFRILLQRRIPWPIDLAVRDGSSMLIIEGPESGIQSIAANYRLLGFRPSMLRSSLGRCFLSYCDAKDRDEIVRSLAHSHDEADRAALSPDNIRRLIDQVRSRGYALRDASHTPLTSPERYGAIAVPIMCDGVLTACLSCSWHPDLATSDSIVKTYLETLKDAADSIGRKLKEEGAIQKRR